MGEAQRAAEHNTRHLRQNGPGLSYGYQVYVVARRPSTGEVLLGGLGAMGMGQMWRPESEDVKSYPGYSEAEIVI